MVKSKTNNLICQGVFDLLFIICYLLLSPVQKDIYLELLKKIATDSQI